MKSFSLLSTSFFLATAMAIPATSFASYNKDDAKHDCKSKIRSTDRYDSFHSIKVEDKRHNSFEITGKVKSNRDNKNHFFNCQIRHREITSWHVNSHPINSSNSSSHSNAAAVGAGVLGIAAVAAILKHNYDKDHDEQRDQYHSGSNKNPFDDMKYLKNECKRTLRSHLNHDHGTVNKLKLEHTHLDHRKLRGDGWVSFRQGRTHDLSFTCKFDRNGRIHDGHYRYITNNNSQFSDEYSNNGVTATSYEGIPEISYRPSGEIKVKMSRRCTVLYNNRGHLIDGGQNCTKQDRHKASTAIEGFLREQNM